MTLKQFQKAPRRRHVLIIIVKIIDFLLVLMKIITDHRSLLLFWEEITTKDKESITEWSIIAGGLFHIATTSGQEPDVGSTSDKCM